MKRTINLIILLSVLVSIIFPQKTIAVLDFDANDVSKSNVRALSDRLREELFRTKKYRVLERGLMEEIMKEQKFQLSGCVSTECIVEVGQLTGVQKMVGGSVSKVGSVYSVSSRIIDIETGEISNMSSYDHTGNMGELLTQGMRFVAIELAKEKNPQSLTPQDSGVEVLDIGSSLSGDSIGIDEISINEITSVIQKNITEGKPTLSVYSEPTGAHIYIDNSNYYRWEGTTPNTKITVDIGVTTIKIKVKGYEYYSETFTLESGDKKIINAFLIKK